MAAVTKLDPIIAYNTVTYFLHMSTNDLAAFREGTLSMFTVYERAQANLKGAQGIYEKYQHALSAKGRLDFWNEYDKLEKTIADMRTRMSIITHNIPSLGAATVLQNEAKA